MSSLDSLQTKALLARGVILRNGTDTPIALRLRYKGTGTVTSVTVTTATNIVMVTSDGGTDTYAFGTYSTLGALADAINGDGIFEAKVLDDLRSSATASQYVTGAITAGVDGNGVRVWDVELDTSAALRITASVSSQRDFDQVKKRVKVNGIVYSVNMGTAAADSAQLYLRRGTSESLVWSLASVDTTETTLLSLGSNAFIGNEQPGDEYIFLVKDAATLADAAGNHVTVSGVIE